MSFHNVINSVRLVMMEVYKSIDIESKKVVKPIYDHISTFADGLAAVEIGGKFGFINQTGDTVISLKFDHAEIFSEGLGGIKKDNMVGLVNAKGQIIIPLQSEYELEKVHSEDIIVPREYDTIYHLLNHGKTPAYEEVFMVEKGGSKGLIAVRDF